MVDYFLDERTGSVIDEARNARRIENEKTYLAPLLRVIASCRVEGNGYRAAIAHWIASLDGRLFNRIQSRRLKIPNALREALGLSSQHVIFENGCLWSAIDGGKVTLLYSPIT